MKSPATLFAAVASMALVSACATANGQTSDSSASVRASASDSESERDVRVFRVRGRGMDFESIIDEYDSDEDGRISKDEYNDRPNRGRFAELDANEDGFVDLAELESDRGEREERRASRMAERMERHAERAERHAERAMRNAERYEERILKSLDRNDDGEIDEHDFDFDFEFDGEAFEGDMKAFEERMEKFSEEMEKRMAEHRGRALKKFDTNEDGVVSRDEFSARHDKQFDKMDKDGDGTLSADELDGMAMMRGFEMPDFTRMGRMFRGPGRHMFRWRDKDGDWEVIEGEEEKGESDT